MKQGIRRIKNVNKLRAPSHAIMALACLRNALDHCKLAGACYTAARVRSAISSAKGAVRAAQYRQKERELTAAQAEAAARAIEGDLWKPHFEVSRETDDHYWRDLAECPRDQWRGPFKTARAAWLDILATYGERMR